MFESGQRILCINDRQQLPHMGKFDEITTGVVYTVESFAPWTDPDGMTYPVITLIEAQNLDYLKDGLPYVGDIGFAPNRFRPLDGDPMIEMFREEARKVDDLVPADA